MGISMDLKYVIPADGNETFDRYFKEATAPNQWGDIVALPTDEYLDAFVKELRSRGVFKEKTDDEIKEMFSKHAIDVYRDEKNHAICVGDSFNGPGISVIPFPDFVSRLFPDIRIRFSYICDGGGDDWDIADIFFLNGEVVDGD